jgi:hypothetical protein
VEGVAGGRDCRASLAMTKSHCRCEESRWDRDDEAISVGGFVTPADVFPIVGILSDRGDRRRGGACPRPTRGSTQGAPLRLVTVAFPP